MGFDQSEIDTIQGVSVAASVFSLFGCLFIIVCYIKFTELRSFAFTLVFYMSCSDFFASISKMLNSGGMADSSTCVFQAVSISFFELVSILWAASIAFTLHKAYLQGNPVFGGAEVEQFSKKYHLVIWGSAAVLTLLPLTTDSYGETSTGWCWIKNETGTDMFWRYIQFYLILWFAWGYSFFVYINVLRKMQSDMEGTGSDGLGIMRRIIFYPIVLVVCWFPASINRLVELFTGGESPYWLTVMHVLFVGLYGLGNSIVYGLTPAVKKKILEMCGADRGHFGCMNGEEASSSAPAGNADLDIEMEEIVDDQRGLLREVDQRGYEVPEFEDDITV